VELEHLAKSTVVVSGCHIAQFSDDYASASRIGGIMTGFLRVELLRAQFQNGLEVDVLTVET